MYLFVFKSTFIRTRFIYLNKRAFINGVVVVFLMVQPFLYELTLVLVN